MNAGLELDWAGLAAWWAGISLLAALAVGAAIRHTTPTPSLTPLRRRQLDHLVATQGAPPMTTQYRSDVPFTLVPFTFDGGGDETYEQAQQSYDNSDMLAVDALDWVTGTAELPADVVDVIVEAYRCSAAYETAVDDIAEGERSLR